MPFIGPSKRIGPDLDTEWGNYTSPFFTAPADAKGRGIHFEPSDIRGRHRFRAQPRDLSIIPDDPAWAQPALQSILEKTRSSLVPENAEAFGYGATPGLASLGLSALFGPLTLGVLGAWLGKKKGSPVIGAAIGIIAGNVIGGLILAASSSE